MQYVQAGRQFVIPPEWTRYHAKYLAPFSPLGSAGLQSQGTLFLHERRSPSGNRRLVSVDLRISWGPESTAVDVEKRAIVPGGWRSEPKETWGGPPAGDVNTTNLVGQRQHLLNVPYGKTLKVIAGRPDPSDASHFTIDYEIDGRSETIDGRLNDDDSVDLKLRNAADAIRPRH
jgi:hypothetical protein